jgi:hypothetical protein
MINLQEGQTIYSTKILMDSKVQHWKYKDQCDRLYGSFAPGSAFKIVDVNRVPGDLWVRVLIPGSDPSRFLKIWGGDYSGNFSEYKL